MISTVPIELITESLAYVPGIRLGEAGSEPVENEVPEVPAPEEVDNRSIDQ